MLKKYFLSLFMMLVFLVVSIAVYSFTTLADEVNIYSARKEELIMPLLNKFTDRTGIKVNLLTGKADELLKRLESEGINSPADLLLTVDAGRLARAQAVGILQPIFSSVLDANIPSNLRDPGSYWYGLSVRARTIMYAKDRVSQDELSTYEALTDPKWKGRILIRSSNSIYNQSLVASMIETLGVEKTEKWARSLLVNLARPPKGGDRDQIRGVAAGEGDICIANTYYLGKMMISKNSEDQAAADKIAIFWPNQNDRGTHINISGAGVTKSAKNKENAIKLLEFLISDEAQQWYGEKNLEYPVKRGVAKSEILKSWGEFKTDGINLTVLGKNNAEAIRIMDRVGWK